MWESGEGPNRSLRAVNIWAGLPGSASLCPESRQHPGMAHGHRTLGRHSHLREEFPSVVVNRMYVQGKRA